MAEFGAPPKRGEDTPVPDDIATRRFEPVEAPDERDALIPKGFVEQRAEERASRPASFTDLYVVPGAPAGPARAEVANPLQGGGPRPLDAPGGVIIHRQPLPGGPQLPPRAEAAAPAGHGPVWHQAAGHVSVGHAPGGYAPAAHGPAGYGPAGYGPAAHGPVGYGPAGYAPAAHGPVGYGAPPQHAAQGFGYSYPAGAADYALAAYGQHPYVQARHGHPGLRHPHSAPMLPPREPWKPGQRAAALWGSFVQHVLFGLGAQILVLGGLFLALASTSWDGVDGVLEDELPGTFTDFMVWLAKPEHVALSAVILLLVTGTLIVAGYYVGALWQRAKGLGGVRRAYWLTAVSGGSISAGAAMLASPVTFILWILYAALGGNGAMMAGMWAGAFIIIGLGAVMNGFICMGFGRMFLGNARPRVDYRKLAEEAEARARALDEQALAPVPAEERYRIDGT